MIDHQSVPVINGEIWNRNDFGTLCEWRMLYRAIEVGVDRGEFANVFLHRCYNCSLYLGIDSFEPYGEMQWDRTADFQAACLKFERHASRAKLIRARSSYAVEYLMNSESKLYNPSDTPYDFIYLDASHKKQDIQNELFWFWPFLSPQGILAGHDWSMKTGDHPGVQQAVREFAAEHGLSIHVTWMDDPASWYVFKDKSVHPWRDRSGTDKRL